MNIKIKNIRKQFGRVVEKLLLNYRLSALLLPCLVWATPAMSQVEFTDAEKEALLRKYAPQVRLSGTEEYFPSKVDYSFDNMLRAPLDPNGETNWITSAPLPYPSFVMPYFRGESDLAKVPIYAYWMDKRGADPGQGGEKAIDLVYFTYYPYNRGKHDPITDTIWGNHVGDWEHITVRLMHAENNPEYGAKELWYGDRAYLAHHESGEEVDLVPEMAGTPTMVMHAGAPHIYWRSSAGMLYDTQLDTTTGKWVASKVPGAFMMAGNPVGISHIGFPYVFWRGKANQLSLSRWTGSDWLTESLTANDVMAGDPTVVIHADQPNVFWRDNSGALQQTVYRPATNTWESYTLPTGAYSVAGNPYAITHAYGPHIYWRSTGGNLIETRWSGTEWITSAITTGFAYIEGDPTVITYAGEPNIFWRDTNGQLNQTVYNGYWDSLTLPTAGTSMTGTPTAQLVGTGMEVYYLNDTGNLSHTIWDGWHWLAYDLEQNNFPEYKLTGNLFSATLEGQPQVFGQGNTAQFLTQWGEGSGGIWEPIRPGLHVQAEGLHPVAYAAWGSHGLWATPGSHVYFHIPLVITLSDETDDGGIKWNTWNKMEKYDYLLKTGLENSTWPTWMDTDYTLPGSSPYIGNFYRWGNNKDYQVYNTCIPAGPCQLENGPTGPAQKDGIWNVNSFE